MNTQPTLCQLVSDKRGQHAVRDLKPIELLYFIKNDYCQISAAGKPSNMIMPPISGRTWPIDEGFETLVLISAGEQFDIIAKFSKSNADPVAVGVFLGHWNDGIIK